MQSLTNQHRDTRSWWFGTTMLSPNQTALIDDWQNNHAYGQYQAHLFNTKRTRTLACMTKDANTPAEAFVTPSP